MEVDANRLFPPVPAGSRARAVAVSSLVTPTNAPCEDGTVLAAPVPERVESLFAVIDGHGGAGVKNVLVSHLGGLVRTALDARKAGEGALQAMFDAGEQLVLNNSQLNENGACAVALLLTPGAEEEISVVSSVCAAHLVAHYFSSSQLI